MRYEGLLFDMDGVVVDTRQAIGEFWNGIAIELGVTPEPDQVFRHIHGCSAGQTLDALFPGLGDDERRHILSSLESYETNQQYYAIPGVVSLLRACNMAEMPIALVTGAEPWKAFAVMHQLAIERAISVVVTASDVAKGKPDPEGYILAAKLLGTTPNKCIVFEDSVPGVQAAYAASAYCIGVDRGSHFSLLLEYGAGIIIPDFAAVSLVHADQPGEVWLNISEQHKLLLALRQ